MDSSDFLWNSAFGAVTRQTRAEIAENLPRNVRAGISVQLQSHFNGTFTGYNGGACGKLAPERPRGAQNVQLRRGNGYFRNLQNELRCFYNGIRGRFRRLHGSAGVFAAAVPNSVGKTT